MSSPLQKTEMADLFGIYFCQDYDLFTNIDWEKPFISQVVASYKKDCSDKELGQVIEELTTLITFKYSEEKLKNEVFPDLGIEMSMSKLGLTYHGFLEEVLEELTK